MVVCGDGMGYNKIRVKKAAFPSAWIMIDEVLTGIDSRDRGMGK